MPELRAARASALRRQALAASAALIAEYLVTTPEGD